MWEINKKRSILPASTEYSSGSTHTIHISYSNGIFPRREPSVSDTAVPCCNTISGSAQEGVQEARYELFLLPVFFLASPVSPHDVRWVDFNSQTCTLLMSWTAFDDHDMDKTSPCSCPLKTRPLSGGLTQAPPTPNRYLIATSHK